MSDMAEAGAMDRNERLFALFTGIVLLWLMLNGIANALFFPGIPPGAYADAAKTVTASAWQYRLDSADLLVETLSGVLLEFGLYALLKRVNSELALLGLLFMAQDSCMSGVLRGLGFARVGLYASPAPTAAGALPLQNSAYLIRWISDYIEKVGGIYFGIGLLLFFYLFFRSAYLPKILSILGLIVSAVWIGLYFVILLKPEVRAALQYPAFAMLAAINVASGIFLIRSGLKASANEVPRRSAVGLR
jgi:hypothetical protein